MNLWRSTAALLLASVPLRGLPAHSIAGNDHTASWDPPVVTLTERERPDPVNAFRYVIDRYKLWPTGSELTVCFFEGDAELRRSVAAVAQEWVNAGANLRLNFGEGQAPRDCMATSPAHIRISFRPGGNWSYVGRDSVSVDLNDPSMNLGVAAGIPFSLVDYRQLAQYVRHEFGHALGLQHEHQSPNANCDIDWSRVYTELGGPPNNWSPQTTDLNLRPLVASVRLQSSPYDRNSIMHYSLPSWTFVRGTQSPCYVTPNELLSEVDKQGVRLAYPQTREAQNSYLDQLDISTRQILTERNASPDVVQGVEQSVNQIAAAAQFPQRSLQVTGNVTTQGVQSPVVTNPQAPTTFNFGNPPATDARPSGLPR